MKKLILSCTVIGVLSLNKIFVKAADLSIGNNILKTTVKGDGRFGMSTVEGDFSNSYDNNKKMLYGYTNAEAIKIDGMSKYISSNQESHWKDVRKVNDAIVSTYNYNGIEIVRTMSLEKNPK